MGAPVGGYILPARVLSVLLIVLAVVAFYGAGKTINPSPDSSLYSSLRPSIDMKSQDKTMSEVENMDDLKPGTTEESTQPDFVSESVIENQAGGTNFDQEQSVNTAQQEQEQEIELQSLRDNPQLSPGWRTVRSIGDLGEPPKTGL